MRLSSRNLLRSLVLIVAIGVLLLPSIAMAATYTSVDLNVALAAISICIWGANRVPRLKWVCAACASLLIAVPPYPYWLSRDMERGWYFHPFYGFSLQNTLFLRSLGAYLAALALFAAIFWALSKRVQVKP
jgi:hypothetical protein